MTRYSRSYKDNSGLYMAMAFLCGVLLSAFGIWAIVEFILYLVKDNPFNWWSLGLTITALVGELIFVFKGMLSD